MSNYLCKIKSILIFLLVTFLFIPFSYSQIFQRNTDDRSIERIEKELDRNQDLILQLEIQVSQIQGVLKFLSWGAIAFGTIIIPLLVIIGQNLLEKRKRKGGN